MLIMMAVSGIDAYRLWHRLDVEQGAVDSDRVLALTIAIGVTAYVGAMFDLPGNGTRNSSPWIGSCKGRRLGREKGRPLRPAPSA